jgi:hypothetical protein
MRVRWAGANLRGNDAPPRTPSLRQVQQTECGAVALAIVLAHYGAWVPLPEIRRRCQVSEHGVTALSLVQTGKHYGLTVRAMRLNVDGLQHVQAPVILFWERWHFLILEGIRGNTAWVNDPARGHRTLSLEALRKGYSGVALIAQPGPGFRPIGSPRQPLQTGIELLRPGRWWLALTGAAVLAESLLLPLAVLLAGDAVGNAWSGRAADWRSVALALTALLVASASRLWVSRVARDAVAGPARRHLTRHLADATPRHGLRQPTGLVGGHELAEYPAMTVVRLVTAGIRMTVAVPLLVLLLGRIHPVAALVGMAALAMPFLIQQLIARTAPDAQPPDGRDDASGWHRLGTWWPILRPFVELSPVVVVAVLTVTDRLPAMVVALLASWFAFRLVDSAVQAAEMLRLLPESIIQLADVDRKGRVAERAA